MAKKTKEPRFKIGSTEISSRPDANVIWYADSCDADRGTPQILLMNSNEAKVRKFYNDLKKTDYDIKLYIALATWNKEDECWNVIDDEVIDSWQSDEE